MELLLNNLIVSFPSLLVAGYFVWTAISEWMRHVRHGHPFGNCAILLLIYLVFGSIVIGIIYFAWSMWMAWYLSMGSGWQFFWWLICLAASSGVGMLMLYIVYRMVCDYYEPWTDEQARYQIERAERNGVDPEVFFKELKRRRGWR